MISMYSCSASSLSLPLYASQALYIMRPPTLKTDTGAPFGLSSSRLPSVPYLAKPYNIIPRSRPIAVNEIGLGSFLKYYLRRSKCWKSDS